MNLSNACVFQEKYKFSIQNINIAHNIAVKYRYKIANSYFKLTSIYFFEERLTEPKKASIKYNIFTVYS